MVVYIQHCCKQNFFPNLKNDQIFWLGVDDLRESQWWGCSSSALTHCPAFLLSWQPSLLPPAPIFGRSFNMCCRKCNPTCCIPPTHLSLATNATNSPQTDLKARLDVWGNLQPTNLRPLTRTLEDTDLFRFQSKFLTKLKFCSLSNIIGNKSCVLPANLMSAHNVSFCLNVHCTLLVKPRNQPTLPWWYQLLLAFLVQFYSDKLNDL